MLDALRRRFDVIYTRVKSLREGDAYSTLRNNREFEAACLSVSGFLDAVVPLIDGPDSVLLAALPQIRARAAAQNARVRQLSLGGLSTFAEIAETRRAAAANMLVRMATVLGLIFAGLAVLSLSLLRLIRLGEERAETLRRTGVRLRTIVEMQRALAHKREELGTFHELDETFHQTMIAAVGFPGLHRLIRSRSGHLNRVRRLNMWDDTKIGRIIDDHNGVIAGLETRDPDKAEAAIRKHLGQTIATLDTLRAQHGAYFKD